MTHWKNHFIVDGTNAKHDKKGTVHMYAAPEQAVAVFELMQSSEQQQSK